MSMQALTRGKRIPGFDGFLAFPQAFAAGDFVVAANLRTILVMFA